MLLLLEQIKTFFLMSLFGFFTGLAFKIYQLIISKNSLNGVIIHLSDLIISIVFGIIGFLFLIYINGGDLRFYVILAILSGFVICLLLIKLLSKMNND